LGAILHSLRVKPVVGFRVGRTSPVVGIIAAHRYFPRLACSYREHFYRDSPDFLPVSRFDRRLSERNAPLSAYRCRYSFPSPIPSACLSVSLIPKRQRSTPTRLPSVAARRSHPARAALLVVRHVIARQGKGIDSLHQLHLKDDETPISTPTKCRSTARSPSLSSSKIRDLKELRSQLTLRATTPSEYP
jgi:hypothetical protein